MAFNRLDPSTAEADVQPLPDLGVVTLYFPDGATGEVEVLGFSGESDSSTVITRAVVTFPGSKGIESSIHLKTLVELVQVRD